MVSQPSWGRSSWGGLRGDKSRVQSSEFILMFFWLSLILFLSLLGSIVSLAFWRCPVFSQWVDSHPDLLAGIVPMPVFKVVDKALPFLKMP